MTRERDIERLLDAWFADGPAQLADHVFDEAVGRVHRQRQRPAWRFLWKELHVTTQLKVALGAAAVIVVFVAGFAMLGPGGRIGGVDLPTASPAPSPSRTPSPPPLPDGRLNAGDYALRALPDDPMAFTITAPGGWTGYGGFFIGGPSLSDAPSGIGISVNHDPQVVTDPCDSSVHTPSPASSVPSIDDLVAAISARGDIEVSGVTDAELAGYSGKRFDVQFPAELACAKHYLFAEPKGLYANGPANHWRVWLVDVDGETAVVVLLDYAGTPTADRDSAQAAINSIRITRQ